MSSICYICIHTSGGAERWNLIGRVQVFYTIALAFHADGVGLLGCWVLHAGAVFGRPVFLLQISIASTCVQWFYLGRVSMGRLGFLCNLGHDTFCRIRNIGSNWDGLGLSRDVGNVGKTFYGHSIVSCLSLTPI